MAASGAAVARRASAVGYAGADCSDKVCPGVVLVDGAKQLCSGHGSCNSAHVCECEAGFAGDDCSQLACPGDCTGHGVCLNGTW